MAHPRQWVKGNAVGAGAFGVVNLAMNTSSGELFVVKSSSSSSETQLHALENEANILTKLNSKHIVQCLGHENSNEANGERKLNLFLEYMAGGSLSDIAEKFNNVLDESIIRLYTREILHGLDYLHRNRIVHCDIKCKNVLLSSNGNIKLADFGCAKKLDSNNVDDNTNVSWQSISGTPLWMAPEVLRNEGLCFASDIWSLGCTIVEMVTGKPPWGAMFKIAFGNELPPLPAKLSKEGIDFLNKCLQRDPKMRWTAKELLSHPFVKGKDSCKEDVCSPASVLDVGFEDEDDGDDGLDSSRVPFSSRHCGQIRRLSTRQQRNGDCSDNWITVRSG